MEIKIQIDDESLRRLKHLGRRVVLTASFVGLSGVALYALALSKPYSFTDGAVVSAGQVNSNFDTVYTEVSLMGDSTNIRAVVNKTTANSFCPSGNVAVHVPFSFKGKTGNQICAADGRGKVTCGGVKYVYVTNSNGYGSYTPNDLSCTQAVNFPWPWGSDYDVPNSLDSEWGHGDTWVVCCR